MKINFLELSGYRRLMLNHIHYIKLTPQSKIQLILGTNGSGKSSLLKELSPLPAAPAEFSKDGYKIIEILHNNSLYLLKSIFSVTGNKFHFIKDTEELNPGGTATSYKELVKREFNITQDVHDLMTGYSSFHSMSVAERRSWFTRISDSDYTYAIHYYQKLREQLRDIQGAIKLNQSRLVQESTKLLSPDEEASCREQIANLNKLVASLLELKTPTFITKDQIDKKIYEAEAKIETTVKQLIEYRKKFLNLEQFDSIHALDLAIIDAQSSIQTNTRLVNEICENIEKQQQTIDILQKTNLASAADIEHTLASLTEEMDMLCKKLQYNMHFDDPKEAYNALLSVFENLVEIATTLEANGDKTYSRDIYASYLEKHKELSKELLAADGYLNDLINKKKELEHFKEHNQVECPRCHHAWVRGYDDEVYKNVLTMIQTLSAKVTELKEKIVKQDELIQKTKEYLEIFRGYTNISRSWPVLNSLWTQILQTEVIFHTPRRIINIIETLKSDLQIRMKLEEVFKKHKDNEELKELLEKNKELDIGKVMTDMERLNNNLYLTNANLQRKKELLSRLNMYRQASIEIDERSQSLEDVLEDVEGHYDELLHIARREALNETIQVVQMELTKCEQVISRIDIQKALVNSIEAQLYELIDKQEVLKIAVKELSPTEGLIARGLTGFINHFVNQINSFIKKIWLYPLELIPIAPEEDDSVDLDYKFSVLINGEHPIPDIAKASSAMKEVIDLAFKVVSMQYLGLSEAPLFLDEFSHSFDSAHRQSAFYAITNLLVSSNFSQIFMISHYENSYGSLKNSDITVLCPSNVVLPKDTPFNQRCIMR